MPKGEKTVSAQGMKQRKKGVEEQEGQRKFMTLFKFVLYEL